MSPNRFAPLERIPIACVAQSKTDPKESGWIFDCGATDTMSYDMKDFSEFNGATKSQIQTPDGELTTVGGSGTIKIIPNPKTYKLSLCAQIIS